MKTMQRKECWFLMFAGQTRFNFPPLERPDLHQEIYPTVAWRWIPHLSCHEPAQNIMTSSNSLRIYTSSRRTRGNKPQKGRRLGIFLEARMENTRPSDLACTAASTKEREIGTTKEQSVEYFVQLSQAHLGAVLLIRAERTIKHDDPVAVETQLNGILLCQLRPRSRRSYETLAVPCEDVQLPDPLHHQVKVHAEAPDCSGVCTGKTTSTLGILLVEAEAYKEVSKKKLPGCWRPLPMLCGWSLSAESPLSPSPTQIKP